MGAALGRLQQLRQMLQAAQQGSQQGQQNGGQRQQGQQGQGGQQGGQQNGGASGAGGNIWNNGGQFYRDTLQDLSQLQQQLKDDPTTQHDLQNVIRDLRQFEPGHYTNDPMLNERIQAALANVEQVELELRRKVDALVGGGSVRSPGNQSIPEGYLDAVAEYYRKLSQTKKP